MRRALFAVLACMILCSGVSAGDFSLGQEKVYASVPPEAAGRMGEDGSFSGGVEAIVGSVLPELSRDLSEALRCAGIMLCAMLLCAVSGGKDLDPAVIAGVLCIGTAGFVRMGSLAGAGAEAIVELQSFADVLLPAMSAATAAAGGVTASTGIYAATALFSDLLMHAMGSLLLPVIHTYVALCCARALCESELLDRLAKLVKWAFQGGIKVLMFIYTAYLSITALVSGSADATVVKAAKLALSGVVPVVGSMISDCSETVIVSAGAIKNAVGVFGMLAVIAICIGPFVRTAVHALVLRATAAAGSALGNPRLLSVLDALCEAMGFALSMVAAAALMLLICCVCYLKVCPV